MLSITLLPKTAARLEALVSEFNTVRTKIDIVVDTLVESAGVDPSLPRGNLNLRPGEGGKMTLLIDGISAPLPAPVPPEAPKPE
jgi:hypothetical protein